MAQFWLESKRAVSEICLPWRDGSALGSSRPGKLYRSFRYRVRPLPSVAALFSSRRSRRLTEPRAQQAVPWSITKSPGPAWTRNM